MCKAVRAYQGPAVWACETAYKLQWSAWGVSVKRSIALKNLRNISVRNISEISAVYVVICTWSCVLIIHFSTFEREEQFKKSPLFLFPLLLSLLLAFSHWRKIENNVTKRELADLWEVERSEVHRVPYDTFIEFLLGKCEIIIFPPLNFVNAQTV